MKNYYPNSHYKKTHRRNLRYVVIAINICLVCVLASFSASSLFAGETVERILVIVNDEIITSRDLNSAVEPVLSQYRATMTTAEYEAKRAEAERMMLEKLIEERLIRSAAKHEGIEVDEAEIDEMMDEVKSQFPSAEAFERVLNGQGMTFTRLREKFRDQILGRRMVDIKVRSLVSVSPGEVREYYDSHSEEFVGAKKAKVRQILVRTGAGRTEEEAKAIALSIIDEIWKGESVAALAERYSEASEAKSGGDMGWIEENQLVEYINNEIFSLSPGEYTDPIRSQLGYHVFKVEEIKEPEIKPFEQVRKRIENFLYKKKTAEHLDKWLKDLRDNAYIVYQA